MTTIADIAHEVGVDKSVVSRALRDVPDPRAIIKPETRRQIIEVAQRLGYRRNRVFEFLKKGKAATILCFVPDIPNRIYADLMFGISEEATREGFPVNFFFGRSKEDFSEYLGKVGDINHSGMLSYPMEKLPEGSEAALAKYQEKGHVIFLNTNSNTGDDGYRYKSMLQVNIDDQYGGQLAAEHLIQRGCRDFLIETCGVRYAGSRVDGFSKTVKARGFACQTHEALPLDALRKRRPGETPLGIFCVSDAIALLTMLRLSRQGLEVGREVLLVGYDDLYLGNVPSPELTTVRQPMREEGALAVRKLVRVMSGDRSQTSEFLKPSLVARESTGGA